MELQIYKQDGTLRTTISPADNSTHQQGIMSDNVLALSFRLYEFVPLEVNDYVVFLGERFTLLDRYRPQMISTVEFQYDVMFYGLASEAKKALMLKMVDGDNDTSFALTDTPRVHLQLVVDNINRAKGTHDWSVGEVITSGTKVITYDSTSCFEALNAIAEAFETEWWIEGTTINLSRCEHSTPIVLGYEQGLISLSKEENDKAPFYTRLYPIGTTRNIDPARYGASRLRLPGGVMYVERNTQLGIVEHAEKAAFEHIYPRRVGYVGAVRRETRFIEGVQREIYFFKDREGLPFNPNDYEIAGLVKNMTFEGGSLNGQNFETNYHADTQEFELINQYPYENQQLPGGSMIPRTGDPYVLWNIRMPDEYYALAEAELLAEANKVLDLHSVDVAIYKGVTDYIDLADRGVKLTLGRRVSLISPQYFDEGRRESRITKITRKVNEPTAADIECSYAVAVSRLSAIENDVSTIQAAFKEQLSKELHVLKSWDSADPTDYNVFSARRARLEHISRLYPDIVKGFKQFMDGAGFGEFVGGLSGMGGRIDDRGNGELESLVLRRFLEVPELRYNRVDVTVGDHWRAPGGGLIESIDTEAQIITLKLEDGELGGVAPGDICMGVFHSQELSDNATEDYDDSRGNRRFAGFYTVYFSVVEVLDEQRKRFRYQLRPTSAAYPRQFHPCEAMAFVGYGSFTDSARRTSVYATRTYQRYLSAVSGWEFERDNIGAQFGDLSNLAVHGLQMAGYSAYLNNVYTTGVINQISQDGETTAPLPFNKGVWTPGYYSYYDYVTHNGSLWLCTNTEGTDVEPSTKATDWLEWVKKGEDGETDITACGRWESSRTPYAKNSVVTLGRASFMARRDTALPPVNLLKSGDDYLTSGGGYLMLGPVEQFANTDDWVMISPPPVDGEPGRPGEDGEDGARGLQGMIVRVTEWNTNMEYHNDEELDASARFLDVVVVSSGSSQSAYQCKKTHVSTAAMAPGNTTYWQPFNSTVPIYTPLLLAKNAVIKFMQGQEIVVQDETGRVVGGLSGKAVDGVIWPLWAGLGGPAAAPFRVDQYGQLIATNADITGRIKTDRLYATGGTMQNVTIKSNDSGQRVEIDTTSRSIKMFDSANNRVGEWTYSEGSSYIRLGSLSGKGVTEMQDNWLHMVRGNNRSELTANLFDLVVQGPVAYGRFAAGDIDGSGRFNVNIEGLPKTSQNLGSGNVWRDSNGFLRIV